MNRLSRRAFVALVAGAGVTAALPAKRLFAADKSPLKIGIQSYSLRTLSAEKAIDTAAELGFEHVEFFDAHFPINSTDEQIDARKKLMAEKKLRISAHGVNGFGKDHAANKRIFEFAKKAGIKTISADPSEDAFESLDKLVEEYDIRIAIHNHGPGARYDKVTDVLNAIKGHDDRIGACADLGHYIRSAEDPVKVITLLKGRLWGIHLKDFDAPKGNAKGTILGKGLMDVVAVMKALREVQFPADGALSLEYEENANNPVPDVKECLAIAQEADAKAAG
jgi:sugar phosphate isomerase/epimerase